MKTAKIEKIFSGDQSNFPSCPSCGSHEVGCTSTIMVCGSCSWFDTIDFKSKLHTDLSRFKVSNNLHNAFGEGWFNYFIHHSIDEDDRDLKMKHLLERCTIISRGRKARKELREVLSFASQDTRFSEAYGPEAGFPDEFLVALHGRDSRGKDYGAFILDPESGMNFQVGNFIANNYSGDIISDPGAQIEYLASGCSWDMVASRDATSGSLIRFRKVDPKDLTDEENNLLSGDGELFEMTVSHYGFYPITVLMKVINWESGIFEEVQLVDTASCERTSGSRTEIFHEPFLDDVIIQPITWSAIRASVGSGVKTVAPRYISTIHGPNLMITASVSECLDDGAFSARAAIRNMAEAGTPRVQIKTVNGDSVESCIDRIRSRNVEYTASEEQEGPTFRHEKEWDILESDPYATLLEMRNLPAWDSPEGGVAMVKRKPSC